MKIFTPDLGVYGFNWVGVRGLNSIVFSIKACSNAKLALAAKPYLYSHAAYEVILSQNNGTSVIKDTVSMHKQLNLK